MNLSELLQKAKDKSNAIKAKSKTIKPKAGDNNYVLLKGWRKDDESQFWHDFGLHYIKGEDGQLKVVYPCNDKIHGHTCPICQALLQAGKQASTDEQLDLIEQATSKQSYLLNVLALDEDPNNPQILEVGKSVFGQILEVLQEWGADIFDEKEARIVKITREGSGLTTKYTVQAGNKKHTIPSGVFDRLNDLDDYVKQESEENMRKALYTIGEVSGGAKAIGHKPSDSDDVIDVDLEDDLPFDNPPVKKMGGDDEISLSDELDELLKDVD